MLATLDVLVILALTLTRLPFWLTFIIAGAVCLHWGWTRWRWCQPLRVVQRGAQWVVQDRHHQVHRIVGAAFIHPQLTILSYKQRAYFLNHHLIIIPDRLNKNNFRRLRLYLIELSRPA